MRNPYEQPDEPVRSEPSPTKPPVYSTRDYSRRQASPPPPPPVDRESAARERLKRRRSGARPTGGEWLWVFVAAALFGVVLVIALSALFVVRTSQNGTEVIPTADSIAGLPTPFVVHRDFSSVGQGEELVLPDGSSITLVPWDGQSRFTMILAGLDRRPGEKGLTYRTDSMMLVSLDPTTKSIGVLSIPRDLYVQIPGSGDLQRVNTPMVFGETRKAGFGPTLLMQTVQLNLGMRVNDYMLVDFDAVITLVDVLGGIDVELDYDIYDSSYPSMYYGYDPFILKAGKHHLNGYDALRFARTRHGSSDIQRAERQQQVIYAIRDKVLSGEMLPTLIVRAPEIWTNLSDNLYTGLTFEQILQLGLYVKDVPFENIKMGVLDFKYLRPYTTSDGASVLIPNRAAMGSLMVEIFGENYSQ